MIRIAVILGIFTVSVAAADPQRPPSAALAKLCRELAIKARPPVVAGSAKGDASAERDYFAACIKKGGDPDK